MRYVVNQLPLPRVSVYIASSIDGFIAREDGSLEWLDRVYTEEEDYGFSAFFSSVDTLVIGRRTFEIANSVPKWPYAGKRVVVLSKTLTCVREEAELDDGESSLDLVFRLYSEGARHIWVDGGSAVSSFLRAQIVNQMILSIVPILLGSGIPLFRAVNREILCHEVSSETYPTGLVQLRYELSNEFAMSNYAVRENRSEREYS